MKKHYVYKITNLKNNKIYIGVRTHPSPDLDDYMGSGTCIQNVIKIEGIKYFKKEIIYKFNTRKEAEDFESKLLTEEFCNSPETYNIQRTSKFKGNMHGFRKDLWYDYFNDIRKQYIQGKTLNELSKIYRCDKGTIRFIVDDVKRTMSESQILRFSNNSSSGARDLEFDKRYLKLLIDFYVINKWSVNRIATYFKKSCSFIERRLKENSIPKRARKDNNEKKMKKTRQDVWDCQGEIISLYNKNHTTQEIGKKFKTSSDTITKILRKNNITIRNRGTKPKH